MSNLTEDELVATLQRSDLPTVLVEGKTDAYIFRRLESLFGTIKPDFLQCVGRNKLLAVYRRRSEFSGKRVCFVADRDMWVFTTPPEDYSGMIFTEGYSIENDLYSDSDIERLLESPERLNHQTMIQEVARWFSCEVEKFFAGNTYLVDPNLYLLIPAPNFTCCPNHLQTIGFIEPRSEIYSDVKCNYKMKLQGHLLYKVLHRFLAARYRPQGLLEISVIDSKNKKLLPRLIRLICEKLAIDVNDESEQLSLTLP